MAARQDESEYIEVAQTPSSPKIWIPAMPEQSGVPGPLAVFTYGGRWSLARTSRRYEAQGTT